MRAPSRPRMRPTRWRVRSSCSTRVARDEASRARAAGKNYVVRTPGHRRRLPAQLRRARRADPPRQRRHRHRRHRGRDDAGRAEPPQRRPPPHARPARHRRRHLHRRAAADASTTPPIARCGTSTPASSTRPRPIPPCSTSSAPARKLPEEKDFREWKAALHEAYRATEPRSISGTCRTAAPSASSPRPTRRAA